MAKSQNQPESDEVPEELQYLIPYVKKFGDIRSDSELVQRADSLTEEQHEELTVLGEKILLARHYTDVVTPWLKRVKVTHSKAAWMVYMFFGVLDLADIDFDQAEDD